MGKHLMKCNLGDTVKFKDALNDRKIRLGIITNKMVSSTSQVKTVEVVYYDSIGNSNPQTLCMWLKISKILEVVKPITFLDEMTEI